jgi:hypothetical protein
MHAMTGSWLVVKWAGVAIAAAYLLLLLVVTVRFRRDLSRLRGGLILPAVLGVFISLSVPSIFEDVTVTRICFMAATSIYTAGIAILVKGLIEKSHRSLLKADS